MRAQGLTPSDRAGVGQAVGFDVDASAAVRLPLWSWFGVELRITGVLSPGAVGLLLDGERVARLVFPAVHTAAGFVAHGSLSRPNAPKSSHGTAVRPLIAKRQATRPGWVAWGRTARWYTLAKDFQFQRCRSAGRLMRHFDAPEGQRLMFQKPGESGSLRERIESSVSKTQSVIRAQPHERSRRLKGSIDVTKTYRMHFVPRVSDQELDSWRRRVSPFFGSRCARQRAVVQQECDRLVRIDTDGDVAGGHVLRARRPQCGRALRFSVDLKKR